MANIHGNLGCMYQVRGDQGRARECWQKALELFTKVGIRPEIEKLRAWLMGLEGKK